MNKIEVYDNSNIDTEVKDNQLNKIIDKYTKEIVKVKGIWKIDGDDSDVSDDSDDSFKMWDTTEYQFFN